MFQSADRPGRILEKKLENAPGSERPGGNGCRCFLPPAGPAFSKPRRLPRHMPVKSKGGVYSRAALVRSWQNPSSPRFSR